MTALAQAVALYRTRWQFNRDLRRCMMAGYVFSEPDSLLMGFRCQSAMVADRKARGLGVTPADADTEGDTWFVWLAVGRADLHAAKAPYPLKFVAFSRRGVLRLFRFSEIARRLNHVRQPIPPALAIASP